MFARAIPTTVFHAAATARFYGLQLLLVLAISLVSVKAFLLFFMRPIQKSHLPLAEDTCQLGVGGAIEASQVAAVQYKDRVLRCLDARVVNEHTLVLLGTDGGEIMQVIPGLEDSAQVDA